MWILGWRAARTARLGLAVRTQLLPHHAARVALCQPSLPAARPLSTSCVLAKKKGGNHTEKTSHAAAPADVEPQLDLDETAKHMLNSVARCKEIVQALVGSLGRVDPSTYASVLTPALLDDIRVVAGKGAKPAPLHNYATVGVRDSVLLITAYEPSVRPLILTLDSEAHRKGGLRC